MVLIKLGTKLENRTEIPIALKQALLQSVGQPPRMLQGLARNKEEKEENRHHELDYVKPMSSIIQ